MELCKFKKLLWPVSGRVPNFPVILKTSGHVFEKELIEKHIRDDGKCPITGDSLTMDNIIEIIRSNSKKESAFPQLPDSITKEIKVKLSKHRIHRYRKISPSLATVDALQGYTFSNDYTLHKTKMPGVLCMDIDNSRGFIATGGVDTTVVVFDLLSRKIVSTLSGHSKKDFPALLNFVFRLYQQVLLIISNISFSCHKC